MRASQAQYEGTAPNEPVRTQELYTIPRIGDDRSHWSKECGTWPRYHDGCFSMVNREGESMLELSDAEQQALQIVVLRTSVQAEK